ncbi:uncharacterized, partial [Tachysurus ichikawai]
MTVMKLNERSRVSLRPVPVSTAALMRQPSCRWIRPRERTSHQGAKELLTWQRVRKPERRRWLFHSDGKIAKVLPTISHAHFTVNAEEFLHWKVNICLSVGLRIEDLR